MQFPWQPLTVFWDSGAVVGGSFGGKDTAKQSPVPELLRRYMQLYVRLILKVRKVPGARDRDVLCVNQLKFHRHAPRP